MKNILFLLFTSWFLVFTVKGQSNIDETQLYEWNLGNVGSSVGERTIAIINAGTIGSYTAASVIGQIIDGNGNWGAALPIVANFKLFVKFTGGLAYRIEQDVLTPNLILRLKSLSATQVAIIAYCPNSNRQLRVFFRYTSGLGPTLSLGSPDTLTPAGTVLLSSPTYNSNLNGKLTISNNGSTGYALAVAGSAIAESITVKLQSEWPDYIFKPDYKLPTLEETEAHIKEKGHLPDIPSATEVAKNGVELGEMNKKLLQKIEELTLHLIEQKKEIQELNKKVNSLQYINNN